jgi:hypothetical protein
MPSALPDSFHTRCNNINYNFHFTYYAGRKRSVGIIKRLRAGWFDVRFHVGKVFFFLQTRSEGHSAAGSIGVSSSFSGNKAAGAWRLTALQLTHGSQTFQWQRATPVIVGFFGNRRGKMTVPVIHNRLNYSVICTVQYNSTNPDAGYPDPQLSGSAWPFG